MTFLMLTKPNNQTELNKQKTVRESKIFNAQDIEGKVRFWPCGKPIKIVIQSA